MNRSIPYPPTDRNCAITFREPFPTVRYEPRKRLYIRAILDDSMEQEIRITSRQQIELLEQLIREDGKILNAKVLSRKGIFELLERSPQTDFFEMVK